MMLKIVLALFTALTFDQVKAEEVGIACKTHNNESAYCINFSDCTDLRELWVGGNPSQIQSEYILNSLCGEENGRIQICCVNRFQTRRDDPRDLLPKPPECGESNFSYEASGGKATQLNQYPWSAILLYYNAISTSDEPKCGGTLIHKRYVLTTANCANKPGLLRVMLGEWDVSTNPDCMSIRGQRTCANNRIVADIAVINVHSQYSAAGVHDIALLRLKKKIEYSDSIKPACLPLPNWLSGNRLVGETVVAVGWGLNETGSASQRKIKAEMNVQKNCNLNNWEFSSSQLCVGPGREGCQGDVGGPLMYMDMNGKVKVDYVVGLTSYGNNHCNLPNNTAVYTRVGAYIDWILAVIEP